MDHQTEIHLIFLEILASNHRQCTTIDPISAESYFAVMCVERFCCFLTFICIFGVIFPIIPTLHLSKFAVGTKMRTQVIYIYILKWITKTLQLSIKFQNPSLPTPELDVRHGFTPSHSEHLAWLCHSSWIFSGRSESTCSQSTRGKSWAGQEGSGLENDVSEFFFFF